VREPSVSGARAVAQACDNARTVSPENCRVLLANADKDELRALSKLVEAGGHDVVALAISAPEVAEAIVEEEPDIAMILIEPDEFEHTLTLMTEIRGYADIPIVVLAREIDEGAHKEISRQAMEVLHLPSEAETVAAVIRLASERDRERKALESRVGEIDSVLERRSTIEQAKGILMERHGIDPDEAFKRIRDHARSGNMRVVDVAASIIAARELLATDPVSVGE
jgi:AmiR/NasT family two-component response regulator